MPFAQVQDTFALLTANGGADGYVTVTDSTPFWPGAKVWVRSDAVAAQEYIITDLKTGNKIGLRAVTNKDTARGGATYTHGGGTNALTAYLTADNASINQYPQVVIAEIDLNKKPLL